MACLASCCFTLSGPASAHDALPPSPDAFDVRLRWGTTIALRDGVELQAALYLPRKAAPTGCVVTMTPYTAQSYHDQGVYFAAHGLAFLSVDVRGRGGSGGIFTPFRQEAADGADVVAWAAEQPYCKGKVAMWGGSYAGYGQWSAVRSRPRGLTTIVPASSPYMGVDAPGKGGIVTAQILPGGIYMSGRTSQAAILADGAFWAGVLKERIEKGEPFASLDEAVSAPDRIPTPLREWALHPESDDYWAAYQPTPTEFAAIDLPILTITGIYDNLQLGAIEYLRRQQAAQPGADLPHYLVIGPWDHAGTRNPRASVGGLPVGQAGQTDLKKLHLDWYRWIMAGGPRPAFLAGRVAYYVMGAEHWRYADSLDEITSEHRAYFLGSQGGATRIDGGGGLFAKPGNDRFDSYLYDPRDRSTAGLESRVDPSSLVDQRLLLASEGKHLVYDTEPFGKDTEISGFFSLTAWIGINRADTDFLASIYEVKPDGSSILLTSDQKRARYRQGEHRAVLISTSDPLRYEFNKFSFVSREIKAGNRLRLVLGPINSIYTQKNYNSGRNVSFETLKDAQPVTVRLFHGSSYPSLLHVPIGRASNNGIGESRVD